MTLIKSTGALQLILFLFVLSTSPANAAIKTLNNLNSTNQTFTNDSNVQINSPTGGSVHNIIWNGFLPISRGGTGANSFTYGSIPFISGGIFSQDNENLFWDDVNKKLRIGSDSADGYITTPESVSINIVTGDGQPGNPTAGSINIATGDSIEGGNGGDISIGTSDGGDTGRGGNISIFSGYGGIVSGHGGNIVIQAGSAQGGNSSGGNVMLRGGKKSGTGFDGFVFIQNQNNTWGANLDVSLIDTFDKTFTFPNHTGTLGLLEANQIWSGLNRFEANSNSSIYVGSSIKSGCIALGDNDNDGITYITANNGTLSASSTKPSICQ